MIKHIKYISILILLFSFSAVYSQYTVEQHKSYFYSKIDSLNTNPELLILRGFNFQDHKDSLMLHYEELNTVYLDVNSHLNSAQKIFWLFEMGVLQRKLNMHEEALKTQTAALDLLDEEGAEQNYFNLNYQIAEIFRHIGKKKKSNELLKMLLELPMVKGDTRLKMSINAIASENYENLGEDEIALELCIELYNYHLEIGNLEAAAYNLIQMGRLSSHLESDTSYFEYYHMANDLAEKSEREGRIVNNLTNTGIAYQKAGFPRIGLSYLLKAESFEPSTSDYSGVYLLNALSNIYFALDSMPLAYKYTIKELKSAEVIKAYNFTYHATLRMVEYYEFKNELDSARLEMMRAVELSKIIDNKSFTPSFYKQLSDLSLKLNDYPGAMAYLDSSYKEFEQQIEHTNYTKLHQLRKKSDYHIHRNKISELVSDNKLEQEKNTRLRVLIFSVLFIILLLITFAIIIRHRLRQIQESNINLVKKNIELDKLNKQLNHCEKGTYKKKEPISGEDIIVKKFNKLMLKEEVFISPNLSLKWLAHKLNTNTSYLSAIINTHYNCNLRTLINKHRIDKARRMLVSSEFQHYSMEGIATEVGFKSRSGFYQAFKSVTGLNPSVYVKNYNIAISREEETV